MKFRKKPVVIEAIQFVDDDEALRKLSLWFNGNATFPNSNIHIQYGKKPKTITILTLEGVMTANIGDYIIKGVNGEFYPCKEDIFWKTYEGVFPSQEKYLLPPGQQRITCQITYYVYGNEAKSSPFEFPITELDTDDKIIEGFAKAYKHYLDSESGAI